MAQSESIQKVMILTFLAETCPEHVARITDRTNMTTPQLLTEDINKQLKLELEDHIYNIDDSVAKW